LNAEEILQASEQYSCVVSEAHPCGYFFLSRGTAWGADEAVAGSLRSHLDALEVICGGMARAHNLRAASLARALSLGCTGGTDGHLLNDLGRVVTCAHAETGGELLDAIIRRKTIVIGREKTLAEKAFMGTCIIPHHLPYAVPILRVRWEQNVPRIRRFVEEKRRETRLR
jgi:hypothetical protein